MVQCLVTLTDC